MPASPRPRRLHYWGSNTLIYIAQECTTRGLRCLHLHVQEHNSRCARRHVLRASKDTPVATSCARPRDTRVGLLARIQEDARVGHVIRASAYGARQRCPRWPHHPRVGLHARRPKMAASTSSVQRCTRCLLLAPKMAASEVVTEFET